MGGFGGAGGLGGGRRPDYSAEQLLKMLFDKLEEEQRMHEAADEPGKAYSVKSQLGHVIDICRKRGVPEPISHGVRQMLAAEDAITMGG
jgi:hypothetical protein